MKDFYPCMCGSSDCPTCGLAQGTLDTSGWESAFFDLSEEEPDFSNAVCVCGHARLMHVEWVGKCLDCSETDLAPCQQYRAAKQQ
jgi:hypothetical protein